LKFENSWRKYEKSIRLVAAVVSFGIGGFIAVLGNSAGNPLVILLGFAGLAGGFMLFLSWRRQGDIRLIDKAKREKGKDYKPPNSLNIFSDHIDFAFVEEPIGQSQKSLNDGKYYHIHKADLPTKVEFLGLSVETESGLEEFKLPDDDEDERYYDPTEFANPVTMVSNKKYFTWSASTMQKISIGIMAIVIAGEVVGLIAIGG